ncbi:hypothetical protein GCM10022223_18980 [Kineosporia mesophila]|uniref:Pyrroline-5-carboxylate reductase catalytic N-terminal domain-containing protein n=1 Tax=Kineosporia mesophila TaxID=566012 RepID=A0ABP6ZDA4_9ACTN|nr:NAD(P)-binding domain-containing protein [Kineosporia mesophila]
MTLKDQPTVGILHPGRMGSGIAAQARTNAADVLWCPQGRSEATTARADAGHLTAVLSIGDLVERSDIILSICPPMFAETVATDVGQYDVTGKIFVEANPVTSQQLDHIGKSLPGATIVDGAIIGSVPGTGKKPALYVAGPGQATAALRSLFEGTDVIVKDLGPELGKASALKSAYSIYQKGARVLTALAHALGDEHGVRDELLALAQQRSGSYLSEPDLTVAAAELESAGYPGAPVAALADVLDMWSETRNNWDLTAQEATETLRH